jgi:hypothetical protein
MTTKKKINLIWLLVYGYRNTEEKKDQINSLQLMMRVHAQSRLWDMWKRSEHLRRGERERTLRQMYSNGNVYYSDNENHFISVCSAAVGTVERSAG